MILTHILDRAHFFVIAVMLAFTPRAALALTVNASASATTVPRLGTVDLTATTTAAYGTVTYGWRQVSGPGSAQIDNNMTAVATASLPLGQTPGNYTFQVRATDNNGPVTAAVTVRFNTPPTVTNGLTSTYNILPTFGDSSTLNDGASACGEAPSRNTTPAWNTTETSAPATEAVLAGDVVCYAIGPTLFGRDATTGLVVGSYTTGGVIQAKPVPAKLADGKWYVLVASTDGWVYNIDVAAGFTLAVINARQQKFSARRGSDSGCAVRDSLTASVAVQLAASSNGGFTVGKDLVFVGTHHGCGSNTTNIMYALDANDITSPPIWVFNQFGDYSVDYWSDAVLDYGRNYLYCGSNLEAGRSQNTIWCLNTNNGNLVWADNLGSVHSKPAFMSGTQSHLYVLDVTRVLHAVNPAGGVEYWNLTLPGIPGEYADKPLEAGTGPYTGFVFATTSVGIVHCTFDNDTSAVAVWTYVPAFAKVLSRPVLFSGTGKIYLAQDDGFLHQLRALDGIHEAMVPGVSPNATVQSLAQLNLIQIGSTTMMIANWPGSFTRQFTISFTSFSTWVLDISDSGARDPNLSPFSDGVPNLLRYATGQSAVAISSPSALPQIVETPGGKIFRYQLRSCTKDIAAGVEVSPDLTSPTWTPIPSTMTGDNGTLQTWEAPLSSEVFARLRVTLMP